MFKKTGKWLFWAILVVATGAAALNMGQKLARFVQKENELLVMAGERTVDALRSVGDAGETFLSRAGEKQMTVLLTGVDDSRKEIHSVMLASFDLESETIRIIQIPTDTYVHRESSKIDRLGEIYSSATASALKRGDRKDEAARKGNIALKGFLKESMGIAIDHYISLNTSGLRSLVDTVGGVSIELGQAIDCDDDRRGIHLHLEAGKQTLSGSQAVEFVRLGDDYGELDAPKRFLSAFFRKVKQELSISTVLGLLKTGMTHTVSDLALADLLPLAKGLLNIPSSGVKTVTLETMRATDRAGERCKLLCRSRAIEQLAASLPYQRSIDEAHFDRRRVFELGEVYDGGK